VNKILKPGWLTFPPHDRRPDRSFTIHLGTTISDGNMVTPQVVCFCDIPLPDLPLHMTKYSRFGIAFRREFLISFGANPVFYVANNATVAVTTVELLTHLSDRTKQAAADGKFDRGLYFDINIKVLFDILWILDSLAHDY
jgi:hypothetical protein